MQPQNKVRALESIKQGLQDLGYVGDLIKENYEFADVLGPEFIVTHIPLAAFAQEPPSYRTASFGVAIANGRSGAEFIEDYRSLGAPQIFEIGDGQVSRWKVNGKGMPDLLDEVGDE